MASGDDNAARAPLGAWLSPEGLAVIAAAGATAALAGMPLVLVPGAVAYGIVTWLRLERWKEARAENAWAPEEPPLDGLLPANAARVVHAVDVQRHVLREIASAAPEHRALLAATAARVKELVRATAALTRALQRIEALLRIEDARRAEAAELEARARSATGAAREGYTRALEQQRAKAAALEGLRTRAQQYDAQLLSIRLALETVAAQVVRIKSAEGAAAAEESARVKDALDELRIDVEALAETLDDTETATTTVGGGRPS